MALFSEYWRDNIKSGDFIAYTSKYKTGWSSLWGFLISFFTLSRYSHVGIALRLGERVFLASADLPEVKLEPLYKTRPFYHVSMNVEWNDKFTEEIIKHIGEKYSIIEAIRGMFKIHNESNDKWFCTEFVKVMYEKLGIMTFEGDMTPEGMVKELLEKENKKLVYVDTSL